MESLAFRNSSTQRSTLFGKLKPCCLAVVQALRRGTSPSAAADDADLAGKIDDICAILLDQAGYDASVIDASIADYVFFPLLPILQSASEPTPTSAPAPRCYTARVVENATKCTRILVQSGWKAGIAKDNAQRLLIMLATIASTSRTTDAPEELVVEAYRALAALVKAAGAASSAPLVESNAVPLLAHAVTVMLQGATDSIIPAIQLAALAGIDALYTTVKDLQALASFLPGTVSALVRVVGQPGAHKSPRRVVVRALTVLFAVIANTLGDLPTRRIAKVEDVPEQAEVDGQEGEEEADEEIVSDTVAAGNLLPSKSPTAPKPTAQPSPKLTRQPLNAAWLKATAGQVKIALATVLKLRNHESEDVRDAVHSVCVGLLDECHASLHASAPMLVESAIVTSRPQDGAHADFGAAKSRHALTLTTLENLAMLYPELCDVIKMTAYNWATSLPRAMQASDEDAKQRSLRNLQQAISVLDTLQIDSTTLQASLTAALRDSVVTLVLTAEPLKTGAVAAVEAVPDDVLALATTAERTVAVAAPYKPVLLDLGSQKGTRAAVLDLVAHVGSAAQQTRLAVEMLDFVRDTDGVDQVAAYWLSFELVKAAAAAAASQSGDGADALLDLSSYGDAGGSDSETDAVFENLYAFSVSALAAHSDVYDGVAQTDWRMGAIALEVTAYAAAKAQASFRPELIDVLYPIATYLGASEPRLRSHAVLTLNSIAASCGYGGGGVSELIVDNVDYMLNAVSLRLNTFDISPASTQVLTMMIRLAGPRLVPYLDDVVASIFAALDNYHGYPLFVESLFGVLGEVVQQSVAPQARAMLEAPAGARTGQSEKTHRKRRPDASTTADLVGILDRRQKRRRDDDGDNSDDEIVRGHPTQPWADADTLLKQAEGNEPDEAKEEEPSGEKQGEKHDDTKPEDPKTPTYALLARITTLTQHYLTSPTASLRKSLLDLLAAVAPALGGTDENAFLPLVNAIWPVVVPRLYDGEPYVVVAACHALGALCASAGDFLSTRIQDEWRAQLARWCVRARDAAEHAAKARATASTAPLSRNLLVGARPSVIHLHGRASAQSAPKQAAEPKEIVLGSSTTTTTTSPSTGLGRFAQAVRIWEAVVGLLTDVVAHVKVDDAVYDAIVLVLEPSLTSNVLAQPVVDRAFDALAVMNPDAVWLARYRAGVLDAGAAQPVLDGVQFRLVGY